MRNTVAPRIIRYMNSIERTIQKVPALRWLGQTVSYSLHNWVLNGTKETRKLADFLHGTWLKHPLHPMLTDITLGAWGFGSVFDFIALITRSKKAAYAADTLTALGTLSAIPTALSGLADYSTIPEDAVEEGAVHGVLNTLSFSLFLLSGMARLKKKRGKGVLLSTLALGIVTFSAWLGGELVYHRRVGANHANPVSTDKKWIAVLPATELAEHGSKRVDVNGSPIVLYRYGGSVFALGATCSHAGGPLEQGIYSRYKVQCPWHDSVFDVRDGCVIHGPATQDQPTLRVRIENGQIEVCA